MPSPTLQGYRGARYLWGRWPLSTAYSCFHSGPSLSAPLTSPGILAGPQLTCSGSVSLRTWLHTALKCLSWSFGVMVLNIEDLEIFLKTLCVVCCYRCIIKWRPPCGPLTPSLASWLFSDILIWWALAWSPLWLYLSIPGTSCLAYLLFLPIGTAPSVVLRNVRSCLFVYFLSVPSRSKVSWGRVVLFQCFCPLLIILEPRSGIHT